MKKISVQLGLLLWIVAGNLFAQTDAQKKAMRERMWQMSDEDYKRTMVPDKWKNESAVVLYRTMEYEVKKEVFLTYVYENLYTRNRIKLQDQAAVKDFSEMSFEASRRQLLDAFGSSNTENIFVGIKVVKPDGREREITLQDAVVLEAKQGGNKEKVNKIAVPDLEPGDIIDYYYCVEKSTVYGDFDRVLFPLAGKYPVAKQKLDVHIMRKCYLNAKSLNGAPELKRTVGKKDEDLYALVDVDREKMNEEQEWFYTYRSVPTINFRAYYVSKKSGWMDYFLGKQGEVNQNVSRENLLRYLNMATGLKGKYYPESKAFAGYAKLYNKKETNHETLVKNVYTYWRQRTYAYGYEDDILNNRGFRYGMEHDKFMLNMSRFLQKKKVSHDLIFVTPRPLSDIKDLVLFQDFNFIIRVNSPQPFFIGQLGRFSQYNDVSPVFLGTNAYIVSMNKKAKSRTIEPFVIPASASEDNGEQLNMNIQFSVEEPEKVTVTRQMTAKGISRWPFLESAVTAYDYLKDCQLEKYDMKLMENQSMGKKAKAELSQKISQRKEQEQKDRQNAMKEKLEQSMDVKIASYDKFQLEQTGLWPEKKDVKFTDTFTLEGLLTANGPNLMMQVGKLIGKQVELQKEDLNRKDDIYMASARTFDHTITFQIPDGYEVKGLDKLNVNVTNKTGGFVSKAHAEGSKITLHVKKYYLHNFEKAADWPEMVAFLEAAYQFSQQKLLFKKI